MEFDPAIVLFTAVVVLLAVVLICVIVGATWSWRQPGADQWVIQDLDDIGGRVASMGEQIATFKAEIDDLSEEVARLQDEREVLLAVLMRIAELLEQFPRSRGR
jgi:hypothetical protein